MLKAACLYITMIGLVLSGSCRMSCCMPLQHGKIGRCATAFAGWENQSSPTANLDDFLVTPASLALSSACAAQCHRLCRCCKLLTSPSNAGQRSPCAVLYPFEVSSTATSDGQADDFAHVIGVLALHGLCQPWQQAFLCLDDEQQLCVLLHLAFPLVDRRDTCSRSRPLHTTCICVHACLPQDFAPISDVLHPCPCHAQQSSD